MFACSEDGWALIAEALRGANSITEEESAVGALAVFLGRREGWALFPDTMSG